MEKRIILIGIFIVLSVLIGSGIYFYVIEKDSKANLTTHNACLEDDEIADYEIEKKQKGNGTATIIIRNKDTSLEKTRFQIDNIISATHYHPFELHKCGVYAIREIGFDYNKFKTLNNFAVDLLFYDYSGNQKNIISFARKNSQSKDILDYQYDFRINPVETYLALIRGYFGSPDYAIIIKDIKTMEDVFTLPITKIEKHNPDLAQDISFESGGWTRDGRYFWANTHYDANTLGFIRIDTSDWSVKIMPAPKDVLGGDALNLENGYITVHPGNVWYGVAEITEEEKANRRKQSIGTELHIENLITNKRLFVDKTDEPLWYFKPQWVSDTELQYELPNGEKRSYNL